jgi:hypothetical protein
MPAVMTKYNY